MPRSAPLPVHSPPSLDALAVDDHEYGLDALIEDPMDEARDADSASAHWVRHATSAAPALAPSTLRRDILFQLRQIGPCSPDQLAGQLGASRTGVLQQLRALESAGLVTRQTVRHGVGRPRHLYDVTADAQDLFPSNYDGLASGLIAAMRWMGGDGLVEELFAARRRQLGDRIRRRFDERLSRDAPLEGRVRELAVIQDEQGYLCQALVDTGGKIRLQEHNCAIYNIATTNPAACQAELDLFGDVLGVRVVRESHIASGDRCCSYVIEAPDRAD
jgi:predicted ArsR family transcriptional regulator